MGETTIRFASSRSASRMEENRALVMAHASWEGGRGPNGRQGRETSHIRDRDHKEWRDRSEAVGITNVMGVFGRDGAPGSDRKRARQLQAALRVAISATGWACSDTAAAVGDAAISTHLSLSRRA